jgi:protein TonB
MADANTLHPFMSARDAPGSKRNRKGFLIAVTTIVAAHGLLVAYLYKSQYQPRYGPPADELPVIVTVVHPQVPPPPPPTQSPKPAAAPAHAGIAPPPPIDVKQPDLLAPLLVDKPPLVAQAPSSEPPPLAREAKPRILTNPQFDRKPNADDMAQYYPERANRLGQEGAATIRCTVSAKGALIACLVASEAPADGGFGDAALKLAKVFRLKPATADGAPVDGGVFSTKITFKLPE